MDMSSCNSMWTQLTCMGIWTPSSICTSQRVLQSRERRTMSAWSRRGYMVWSSPADNGMLNSEGHLKFLGSSDWKLTTVSLFVDWMTCTLLLLFMLMMPWAHLMGTMLPTCSAHRSKANTRSNTLQPSPGSSASTLYMTVTTAFWLCHKLAISIQLSQNMAKPMPLLSAPPWIWLST